VGANRRPGEDPGEVPAALQTSREVRRHGDEDRVLHPVRTQRLAEMSAEVEKEVTAGAVFCCEDVLARRGLCPVIPASDGAVEGRRRAPARGALRPVGERVRELASTPQTTWPRQAVRQGVFGAARTPDTR
jgi:hypothetical protein